MIIVTFMIRLRYGLLFLIPALLVPFAASAFAASDHTPPVVLSANNFPAIDVHTDEQVSIAADPYDTQEKCALFRVDYLRYGFMPIRIIVTNTGDKPISLADARIYFITADGDKIHAATPSDIERASTYDSHAGRTIPLPSPLPPIHGKAKTSTKAIEEDFATFEYGALAVEPHTTRAGFLFYDMKGIANPLKGAKLYLRMLRGADGKELFYFEIPFDKYLATQPHLEKRPAD
jgi:hypothetical protein